MKKIFSIILLLVTFAFVQGCSKNVASESNLRDDFKHESLIILDPDGGEIVDALIGTDSISYLSYTFFDEKRDYYFSSTDMEGVITNRFKIDKNIKAPCAFCVLATKEVAVVGYGSDLRKVVDVYDIDGNLLNTIDTELEYMASDVTDIFPLKDDSFILKSKDIALRMDAQGVQCRAEFPKNS